MSDEAAFEPSGREEPQSGQMDRRAGRPARVAGRASGTALRIYKPGQGYYTRMGTALGAGVLAISGAIFLLNELAGLDLTPTYRLPVQWGVVVGFLVVMAGLVYWVAGRNRRTNDFFIATEGEMKKVRWSTRKEVTRSTKVVVLTVIVLGVFLFAWDILFMLFFSEIKVLKVAPGLERLFGSGS